MLISRKLLNCFTTKICVCILITILIFHGWNKIQLQVLSRWQCNPKHISISEKSGSESYNASFSKPVDVVITWVNGSDPSLIETIERLNISSHTETSPHRFRDWGTLRYCLRSVEKFANWVRHIYIVTNGQVPTWLNIHNPKVSIVKHSEIFTNKSHLPTFNSNAIESHIHRIPGLSQQFLYMNDDLFFANTVKPEDFFTKETGFKVRFDGSDTAIPNCAKKCKLSDLNNGICDKECNISNCDWDGEDCKIYGTDSGPHTGLKRLSGYMGSLLNMVLLYNKEFGYVYRKVLAHVPNIIDKTVMDELQNRFPREWEKTSASKVRDQYNIQYPFAYYHYLLRPQLKERGGKGRPIATTYQNFDDYAYVIIRNPEHLEKTLQGLLKDKNKKFVCINDTTRLGNATIEAMCQVVIDKFFKQLLPERSSFELKVMD